MDKNKKKKLDVQVQKGVKNMDTIIKRPCTILKSIEDSFKQIKEVENNKKQFKSLKESRALWKQWAKEADNESDR